MGQVGYEATLAFKTSRLSSAEPMAELTEQSEEIHAGDEPEDGELSNVEQAANETWIVANDFPKVLIVG